MLHNSMHRRSLEAKASMVTDYPSPLITGVAQCVRHVGSGSTEAGGPVSFPLREMKQSANHLNNPI